MITVTIAGPGANEIELLLKDSSIQASTAPLDGLAALAQLNATMPDVLIVDMRGEQRIPPTLADIRHTHAATGIVVVAPTLAPAFLLEALHAGANEVVAPPLTKEKLDTAVSGVVGQHANGAGQVFGFIGAKGGVGATTLAVNVAAALAGAAAPYRTILIDVHPFGGDAALFLGVEPAHTIDDALANIARLDRTLLHDLVTSALPNLDLLAGPDRIVPAAIDSAKLRDVIDLASRNYRYTVLDLPRTDSGVFDALQRVNAIFVVINQELATVRAGTRLVQMLRERYGPDKVRLLLSRGDARSDIDHDEIERVTGTSIECAFPSDYRTAVRALHTGRPFVLDHQRGLAQSIDQFAVRLSRVGPGEAPHREGLFGRRTHAGA